jgi:hypothetical protein
MGRVPVFVFDDHPWIPYLNTSLDVRTYGFMAGLHPEYGAYGLQEVRAENFQDCRCS